jgi:hypothetical protein
MLLANVRLQSTRAFSLRSIDLITETGKRAYESPPLKQCQLRISTVRQTQREY